MNYYNLLGIDKTATIKEIKTAYRKLAQQYHPDKTEGDVNKELLFKQISAAYRTLKNPESRKLYDDTGTDSFAEITVGAKSIMQNMAIGHIENCINSGRILPLTDLINHLNSEIAKLKQTIIKIEESITNCELFTGKIKRKKDEVGDNIFENILSEKTIELRNALKGTKKSLTIHEKAMEMLSKYDSIKELQDDISITGLRANTMSGFGSGAATSTGWY